MSNQSTFLEQAKVFWWEQYNLQGGGGAGGGLKFISHQTPKEREALPFDILVHIAKN